MSNASARAGFLTPREVAKELGCSNQVVRSWTVTGCRVNGQVVVLRCEHVGTRHYIRPEWVEEFKAACAAARQVVRVVSPLRHDPDAAERRTQEVLAELANW